LLTSVPAVAGIDTHNPSKYYSAHSNKTNYFLHTYADMLLLSQASRFIGWAESGMSLLVAQMKSFRDGDVVNDVILLD
jgi:hypothetical protein